MHVNAVNPYEYQAHRKLNRDEKAELITLYESGSSMVELSQKFECHRQTVARQLKKAGVELREQQIRTPDFDQRARVYMNRATRSMKSPTCWVSRPARSTAPCGVRAASFVCHGDGHKTTEASRRSVVFLLALHVIERHLPEDFGQHADVWFWADERSDRDAATAWRHAIADRRPLAS